MNILDYLATEFATFDEKPFNPVDSAVLSQFCMVRAEGIVPALQERKSFLNIGTVVENLLSPNRNTARFPDMLRAELYGDMFTGLVPGLVKENLLALAASPRFRDVRIRDYLSLFDTQQQTQFAATAFTYKQQFAYLGFRGTDASFTGWKEDFNMACKSPVPAQEQAVRYVAAAAPRLPERLIIGGHSKGGNLAMYAALRSCASVQARIERVYSHDGPGFKVGTFDANDWEKLEGRIHRSVPQDSIIGLLMEVAAEPRVVKSTERGIMQHSIFSWEVSGDDFVYLDNLTDSAKFTDAVLTEWLAEFSDDTLSLIGKVLFDALESSGAHDFADFFKGGTKTIALLSEATRNADSVTRDTLRGALRALTDVVARQIGRSVVERLPKPLG